MILASSKLNLRGLKVAESTDLPDCEKAASTPMYKPITVNDNFFTALLYLVNNINYNHNLRRFYLHWRRMHLRGKIEN